MADLQNRLWEATAPSGSDNSSGQDRIGHRRRVRHSATRIGATSQKTFTIGVEHLAWHDDASCRYVDPELFFPEGTPDSRALTICDGCPVKDLCLADAMTDPRRIGIWGGTTNADRDRMRGSGRAVQQAEYRAARRAAEQS